ncbi:hypothetical protein ACUH96_00920 [Dermabacteraceae bacterium P13077]
MTVIYRPVDVAAAVVRFLRGKGWNAATNVPFERAPGMVRVSVVSSRPSSIAQQESQCVVEVWEASQAASFDLACDLWLAFGLVDSQDVFPGIVTHEVVVEDMPVQFFDDLAPDLERHQFTVLTRVRMPESEVSNEQAERTGDAGAPAV